MKIYYSTGTEFNDAYLIDTKWLDAKEDLTYIAEECAVDFHRHRDGWECSWPLTFTIWDEHREQLGTFEIERDIEPVFSAYLKE